MSPASTVSSANLPLFVTKHKRMTMSLIDEYDSCNLMLLTEVSLRISKKVHQIKQAKAAEVVRLNRVCTIVKDVSAAYHLVSYIDRLMLTRLSQLTD